MVAWLYDTLHRDWKEKRRVLTCPTEWGGFTHRYFVAPCSAADLVAGPRCDRRMGAAGIATARSGSRSSATRCCSRLPIAVSKASLRLMALLLTTMAGNTGG